MIDKIQPNLPSGYVNNINATAGAAYTESNRTQSTPSAEVSLSDDALALQRILQAAKDAPDVRADIVQEIKGQIEAGNYKVDVNSLADKLLPFMK